MLLIQSNNDLKHIERLKGDLVAYDIESSGLNPRDDKLLIIALSDEITDIVIDCTKVDSKQAYSTIKKHLGAKLFIAHNAVFDWKWAFNYGFHIDRMHDTMVCERILTAGKLIPQGFSLKAVAAHYLGIKLEKETRSEFIDNPDITLEMRHFEYAMSDVRYLFDIYRAQMERITRYQLDRVYHLEMDLLPCTGLMEYTGIALDKEQLESLIPTFESLVKKASKALQDLFISNGAVKHILVSRDGYMGVNTNSKPQTIKALHALGVDVPSLNAKEVLRWDIENAHGSKVDYRDILGIADDNDFADAIDAYTGLTNPYLRALSFLTAANKLLSSYVIGTLEKYNPNTKRVHGWFSQVGARSTGRYSSDMQQIPQDLKLQRLGIKESIRGCFIAKPGNSLLIADYSGIELVILADRAHDETLAQIIEDSASGKDDMHLYVVRQSLTPVHPDAKRATVENAKLPTVKVLRQGAKRVTYSIMYGVTEVGLSEQLTIDLAPINVQVTRQQGKQIQIGWKEKAFPKSGAWLDSQSYHALTKGYTTSVLGRRRWYDLEHAAQFPWKRGAIAREGSNHPIQASCADLMKGAMVYIYRNMDRTKARIIWSVHDEIIIETTNTYKETAKQVMKFGMEETARQMFPYMGNFIIVKVNESDRYNK